MLVSVVKYLNIGNVSRVIQCYKGNLIITNTLAISKMPKKLISRINNTINVKNKMADKELNLNLKCYLPKSNAGMHPLGQPLTFSLIDPWY
jgi:hypothetical protein